MLLEGAGGFANSKIEADGVVQKTKTELIMYQRNTMDFGDAISSLIIRIIQKKFLAPIARLAATKHVILNGAYADNYSTSFQTREQFVEVSLVSLLQAVP